MSQENCIFCKIIAGEIPSKFIYEDDLCVAFNDISPQAPQHFLVIPREHIASLNEAEARHKTLLGHLLTTCAKIAKQENFAADGFRTVINTGANGGQTVFHLHIHLLGGRQFIFPPG